MSIISKSFLAQVLYLCVSLEGANAWCSQTFTPNHVIRDVYDHYRSYSRSPVPVINMISSERNIKWQRSSKSSSQLESDKHHHRQISVTHVLKAIKVSKLKTLLQTVFCLFMTRAQRLLWPGFWNYDPNVDAPLPPGAPLGCPFFGNNILAGSTKEGPELFYSQASKRLGHPSIWRFYFMGSPVISVTGSKNVNNVLQNKKFNIVPIAGPDDDTKDRVQERRKQNALYSSNSVMFEKDTERHLFLRHLVGAAFLPNVVKKGMDTIVQAAKEQIVIVKSGKLVNMKDLCEKFTLDIAWRQILGLDLKDADEIKKFHKAVNTYVSGIFSIAAYIRNFPGKTLLPPFQARMYLVSKIKERIQYLQVHGPDGSTLSAMLFSTHEKSNQRLSVDDIIENALILLVAGTETTASTLTSAMYFLGLHPLIFDKLKDEQNEIVSVLGSDLNQEILGRCHYLEAFILETMRVVPLSGVNLRKAEETIVLDGKQIPKGTPVFCNIRLTHELDPKTSSMNCLEGFKPERWLDSKKKPADDFIPFGTGSRRCLGASLAMTEMRVFMSTFIRSVDGFDLVCDTLENGRSISLWNPSSIIPKPKDGVPILVRT